MNDLVVKGTHYDLVEIVNVITQLSKSMKSIEVNENNYLFVENQRKKEFSVIIDTYKRVLSESEQEYLQPYKNLVEPLKNALDEILVVEKKLKDDVLAEKKKAFKEEVRAEFYDLCNVMCNDGVLPDFEEIYDEKWYQRNKKEWRESLLKKINDSIHKEKTLTGYIVCELTRSQAIELKRYLTESKIQFRFEEIEGE